MAPIDPAQLLKALSPLLSPQGGIKDADEVPRLSSYLEMDGWETLHQWLVDAKDGDNVAFLVELLALFKQLPMTVERLKSNSTPKLVKALTKHTDGQIRQVSQELVDTWMKLVKTDTSASDEPPKKKKKSSKENDSKAGSSHRHHSDKSSKHSSKDKSKSKDKDDKKVSSKDHKTENKKIAPFKNPTKDSIEAGPPDHSKAPEVVPDSEIYDVVAPVPPTEPEIKKPKMERPRTVKTFGSKLRMASFLEDTAAAPPPPRKKIKAAGASLPTVGPPSATTSVPGGPLNIALHRKHPISSLTLPAADKNRSAKSVIANANPKEGEETPSQPGGIKLIAPKPHILQEDMSFMSALGEDVPPSTVKRKRKPSTELKEGKKTPSLSHTTPPKFSFYKDTLAVDPDAGQQATASEAASGADSPTTTESSKPKIEQETEEDEDVKEASTKVEEKPRRGRPRKNPVASSSPDENEADESGSGRRRSLRLRTASKKSLADDDELGSGDEGNNDEEGDDSSEEKSDTANKGDIIKNNESGDQPEESNSNSSSAGDATSSSSTINIPSMVVQPATGLKSILSLTRSKVKKSVRWTDEGSLRMFHYFELDETERVNVNNIPPEHRGDAKHWEMRMERENLFSQQQKLRRLNDKMVEQIPWRPPLPIELPMVIVEPGSRSEEREIQAKRHRLKLQDIYFAKHMIPDAPAEPDLETGISIVEPRLIPQEEEGGAAGDGPTSALITGDPLAHAGVGGPLSNAAHGKTAAGLPSVLSNLMMSIQTNPPVVAAAATGGRPPMQGDPGGMPGAMPHPGGFPPPGPTGAAGGIPGGPPGPGPFPDFRNGPPMGPPPGFGPPPNGPPPPNFGNGPGGPPPGPGHWAPQGPSPAAFSSASLGPPRGLTSRGPPKLQRHLTCRFFMQNACRFGPGCIFLHPGVNGPPI